MVIDKVYLQFESVDFICIGKLFTSLHWGDLQFVQINNKFSVLLSNVICNAGGGKGSSSRLEGRCVHLNDYYFHYYFYKQLISMKSFTHFESYCACCRSLLLIIIMINVCTGVYTFISLELKLKCKFKH